MAQKWPHGSFSARPEASKKVKCPGDPFKGHLCPLCVHCTPPADTPRLPAKVVGDLPYVPCSGVRLGRCPQPKTPLPSRDALFETSRGCRPPEHPWVPRKNKPQHPLLSGLNNRWPLVSSFYQREGNKNVRLLWAASLESSLSRQRPRKN